jgi:hypothetical protein
MQKRVAGTYTDRATSLVPFLVFDKPWTSEDRPGDPCVGKRRKLSEDDGSCRQTPTKGKSGRSNYRDSGGSRGEIASQLLVLNEKILG